MGENNRTCLKHTSRLHASTRIITKNEDPVPLVPQLDKVDPPIVCAQRGIPHRAIRRRTCLHKSEALPMLCRCAVTTRQQAAKARCKRTRVCSKTNPVRIRNRHKRIGRLIISRSGILSTCNLRSTCQMRSGQSVCTQVCTSATTAPSGDNGHGNDVKRCSILPDSEIRRRNTMMSHALPDKSINQSINQSRLNLFYVFCWQPLS